MFIRAYLRASTAEQDANRAEGELEQFARDHGKAIASTYAENESGTRADRPELMRLIKDAKKGDILLLESIDRLSRLLPDDWQTLKALIDSKGLRIVALDLPTTHQAMRERSGDEFTGRMLDAIGFTLIATRGTAAALSAAGLDVKPVNKVMEGRPHVVDMIKNHQIDLIVNTTEGKQAIADSYTIRRSALQNKISYSTTLAGARATCMALEYLMSASVTSLQDLHQEQKS